jgi:hypothetical protein
MQSQHLLGIYDPIFCCNSTCIIIQRSLKVQNSNFQVDLQPSANISQQKIALNLKCQQFLFENCQFMQRKWNFLHYSSSSNFLKNYVRINLTYSWMFHQKKKPQDFYVFTAQQTLALRQHK